ncbi:MAG TPA: hypothetical protein VME47_16695 [Acetobacteraceae bacterium]|nr:hypothetical protein [Acetobacteraceae bacterium]
MNAAALRDALLRTVLCRPIVVNTVDEGLDVLIQRLGDDIPRATIAAALQSVVADGLACEPVRLPPGALQCHWHLELTPRGQETARKA